MVATSPYAPVRRQLSSLSAHGDNPTLRRSSSGSAFGAVGSGVLLWTLAGFWRRVTQAKAVISARYIFDILSDSIESSLTVHDVEKRETPDELSVPPPTHRRGTSAVLRWIVNLLGGKRSKLGRLFVGVITITRELLLRAVGVTSVLLIGVPKRHFDDYEATERAVDTPLYVNSDAACFEIKKRQEISFQQVNRDRCEIDRVLNFWFGRASPDGAQRSLWMIASSSQELLIKVDSEISEQFRSTVHTLCLSSWTSCNGSDAPTNELGSDNFIFDKDKLHRWTSSLLFGWQGKIAAIVALDQLSRHIHRHDARNNPHLTQTGTKLATFSIPKQAQLDNIAFQVANQLHRDHSKELSTGMIPLPMRIFGIMPLRHTLTIETLTIVQKDVEYAAGLHEEMDKMLRRFRKATNRRMNILQDEARREGKLGSPMVTVGLSNEDQSIDYDDGQILESFPFDADMSQAHEHTVIKTIRNFLHLKNILQSFDPRFNSSRKPACTFRDTITTNSNNKIQSTPHIPAVIVSLSGGVDSMVIASALACIRDTEARKRNAEPDSVLQITAVHIDYANRPESSAEASFVERYSRQLGARFLCRRIDEITRGITARDEYERIARDIRFELYRECARETSECYDGNVGVMLGHHRGKYALDGDLRENVISNAHKGCGPLDLSGMTAVSKNDGVTLFRPLLPLEKTSILDYAHTYGVPYFKDTTPHWSTRGKLRNKLLPLLEEIYGEGSMDNLSSLAEESDDARSLVQQTVLGPFMDRVKYHPMGLTFETAQWKNNGLFFWKFVLRSVLHSVGRGMFSDKSVESFLKRIREPNLKEGWLQCRKDYAVYMKSDGEILIFNPKSFPFQKKDQYELPSGTIDFGRAVKVGPWSIVPDVISDESGCAEAERLLRKKALDSMQLLMQGKIQYYLQLPIGGEGTVPNPLIFVKGFTKPLRPTAWKGLDLKVEQTLPLLGIDYSRTDSHESDGIMQYGKSWILGRVSLTLSQETAYEEGK